MSDWTIESHVIDDLDRETTSEVLFLGDVALAGRIGDVILQQGSQSLFNRLPPGFFNADVVCFNLECCLSRRGEVWEPKPTPLRGLPEFLSVFPRRNCQYVTNVANNHFLDYGEPAALDTLEALGQHGMISIGATGQAVARQHAILQTAGGTIALTGFAPSAHPLSGTAKVNVSAQRIVAMVSHVQALKRQADLVFVTLHQGLEHTPYVDRQCRNLTHRLVDAGADCIICHHPHIIQGIERYNGVWIFHSIGNFVIDADFEQRPHARESLVLRLLLSRGRLQRIRVEPYVIMDSLQPRPATDGERRRIRRDTEVLSTAFESMVRVKLNHIRCDLTRVHDQVSSIREMMRRSGTYTAMKYYWHRIMARWRR